MPYNAQEETLRHEAEWRGFVKFVMYSTTAVVALLVILALTLI